MGNFGSTMEMMIDQDNPRIATGKLETSVMSVCEPVLESLGFECVHVEYHGPRPNGGRGVLRFFIDQPGGVTLDDCVKASRQLDVVLEVEESVAGAYTLEVSSPGLDRPLGRLSDFARYEGSKAVIKTRDPVGDRRNFTGILAGTDGGEVLMTVDTGKKVNIPVTGIRKANLKYVFDATEGQ